MEVAPDVNKVNVDTFIDYCIEKFGWSDLSKDVIMDVGCGEEGFCGKAILAKFPNAKAVIFMDYNNEVLHRLKQKYGPEMNYEFGDILNSSTLKNFKGKMSKVVSFDVFDELKEKKEEAFRNVYPMLIPGGQAAISFLIKCSVHEWLTEMMKNPKWKIHFKGDYNEDMYSSKFGKDHYEKMVEAIGFKVVDSKESYRITRFLSDNECEEKLFEIFTKAFYLPPEFIREIQEVCREAIKKVCKRDEEGRLFCKSTVLFLLFTKPVPISGY